MSQAYLIADTKIHDPEKYESYKRLAKPIVEEFGGEYIIRGGRLDVAQADLWSPSRLVVIRFPNRATALAFLSSEAYQPVKAIRLQASEATVTVVEGFLRPDQSRYRALFDDRFRLGFECALVNPPRGFSAGCAL